ncbi:MAG: hypothetical protein R3266_10745 [Gemmatimonadota bacterium]|nr:hypothetical protein [Gemmatimonadota bacterium]
MSARWRSIALVLLGAIGAIAGQRLLEGRSSGTADPLLDELSARQDARIAELSAIAERRARTAQEVALSQFYRLQEFRRLGTEGQGLVYLVPLREGEGDDPLAAAASGGAVRLPRLAVDEGARALWRETAARLDDLEGSVDPRIFDTYAAIRAFVDEHPWPDGSGLAEARRAGWTDPATVEAWLTLNRALVSRVDGLLAGF